MLLRKAASQIALSSQKFVDLDWTAKGERRASVGFRNLETLWFNTGTLCNIACENCYIESSPRNDRLAYLTLADVTRYLDEISAARYPVKLIGFTGGEPFMNPQFPEMLEESLRRGFQTLTLTNAMKPMEHKREVIAALVAKYGAQLRIRVSLDDWRAKIHDAERGFGSFEKTMKGLLWLNSIGVSLEVAGRYLSGDSEDALRRGYHRLFRKLGIGLDCWNPQILVLLPEMDPLADPPEITETCWGILKKSPSEVMCSNARMVVKRCGAEATSVVACTLLPYDERFELGASLAKARVAVKLAHPYCSSFCVLGGGSCGSNRAASPCV